MLLVVFKFIFMLFKPKIILLLCVVSWLICPRAFAEEGTPGNFKNPIAVQEVLAGKRTAANAAWWGFDKDDSTAALQGAIDSGASKVIVPYMGSEWVVRPIKLTSNQEVSFEPGVVVIAKKGEFKNTGDCLFTAVNERNVTLTGYSATLKMQKKDYMSPAYKQGQWRMIISLGSCANVNISGLKFIDSGGDGLYIGESKDKIPCKDITIKDCVFDNNYRQGISVISVENLRINNCVFRNTSGHPPSAGIDFEPNRAENKLSNIVISNCISENNEGAGFVVSVRKLDSSSGKISVLFYKCYVTHCKWGLLVGTDSEQGPRGIVEFRDCVVSNTQESGMWVVASAYTFDVNFINCKTRNAPIVFQISRQDDNKPGTIRLDNCYVYDSLNRPALTLKPYKGSQGKVNIEGILYTSSNKLTLGLENANSSLVVKQIAPK